MIMYSINRTDDYLEHAAASGGGGGRTKAHKYVKKVQTSSGMRYFYSWPEYAAYAAGGLARKVGSAAQKGIQAASSLRTKEGRLNAASAIRTGVGKAAASIRTGMTDFGRRTGYSVRALRSWVGDTKSNSGIHSGVKAEKLAAAGEKAGSDQMKSTAKKGREVGKGTRNESGPSNAKAKAKQSLAKEGWTISKAASNYNNALTGSYKKYDGMAGEHKTDLASVAGRAIKKAVTGKNTKTWSGGGKLGPNGVSRGDRYGGRKVTEEKAGTRNASGPSNKNKGSRNEAGHYNGSSSNSYGITGSTTRNKDGLITKGGKTTFRNISGNSERAKKVTDPFSKLTARSVPRGSSDNYESKTSMPLHSMTPFTWDYQSDRRKSTSRKKNRK